MNYLWVIWNFNLSHINLPKKKENIGDIHSEGSKKDEKKKERKKTKKPHTSIAHHLSALLPCINGS